METSTATQATAKKPSRNPLGRPKQAFSRRRYSEAVRFLKSAIANPKHPVAIRLNCVTLLLTIYGDSLPPTRAIKEQVKDLVMVHNFGQTMAAQVDKKLADEDAERLLQEQAEAEAMQDQVQRDTFAAVLSLGE